MTSTGAVAIALTSNERYLLRRGLAEWGGAARSTDPLARAMGFQDREDLLRGDGQRLWEALGRGEPLVAADWRRTLLATEIVFASSVVGAGCAWSSCTGLSDHETITLLRAVQHKLDHAIASARAAATRTPE